MNKLTLEKIATSLLKACKDEGLMYKEAAKIFNTEPAYFKMLEREDKREAIPEKVMDRFHSWVYSGKKLKEYKMPGSFEEAQREADTGIENPVMEELADMLLEYGASIIEPNEEPRIKLKPGALARRKKEIKEKKLKLKLIPATEKPKRKYTRKAKENTPEVTPEDNYVKKEIGDVKVEWCRPIITDFAGVPQFKESETDLLKSEIKTLAALLTREYEAAEVLRAQNGYLNLLVKYKERMIGVLESNAKRSSIMINDMSQRVVKLKYRGFWARVFNRPVK
jgi:hypothetical protein